MEYLLTSKLALLIDAENISHKELPRILEEVPRHGDLVLRAVYADWQRPDLQKWLEVAEKNDFKIRHQTNDSKIKNSSDMKLIMDAMEVLYRTPVEIFCVVSNDADYVPLCDKIHEYKKTVIGIGYQHASEAFIRACDKFIFMGRGEVAVQPLLSFLSNPPINLPNPPITPKPTSPPTMPPKPIAQPITPKPANLPIMPPKPIAQPITPKAANPPDIRKLLSDAFAKAPQDANRWVILTNLGQELSKIKQGFRPNTYGHGNLTKLLQSMPDFVEIRVNGSDRSVRLKK